MARTRPPYPEEFRREAVELVRSSVDRSIPEIAKGTFGDPPGARTRISSDVGGAG